MAGSSEGPLGEIVVTCLAGALAPGLPREIRLTQVGRLTVDEVISRVDALSGHAGVRASVERYCAVLVNGTSVQHKAGWQTPVEPGDRVAIVAPMGGGAQSRIGDCGSCTGEASPALFGRSRPAIKK